MQEEMSAVEFLKEKARMTNNCELDCAKCPLYFENTGRDEGCTIFEHLYPDEAVAIIKKWSEEHPKKTRLTEFLKMFPDAELDKHGTPFLCTKTLNGKINCIDDCIKCKNEYWDWTVE